MTDTTTTKPECDPQFNLEHFLNGLTLQPMILGERAPRMPPPKGRSTMIPLQMRPGGYRNLEEIKAFECLDDEVTSFFSNFKDPIGNGEAFTTMKLSSQVPAKDVESMFLGNPYEVHAPSSALFVIERGPIKNVQQLVHTINPELRDHAFYTPARTAILNAQKVDPVYFCTFDASGAMSAVKCVVIALPPWNFSPQDFEDFTTMQAFSDGSTSRDGLSNDPPWRNADRMWAYLHDLCFIHECHHFVLTSYQQWAFGAFSTYYTTGFVTPTTPWDAKPKSVLELFTYWTLDACRTENTIMMEQVSTSDAPCHNDELLLVADLVETSPNAVMALYRAS
ncbi:hypothetical protein JB92DRAFT_2938511 [Gautieria morchelliformis]|nr:hypothetical protein JB92DRAFT_2938511 [Gautieria morchelliformis]